MALFVRSRPRPLCVAPAFAPRQRSLRTRTLLTTLAFLAALLPCALSAHDGAIQWRTLETRHALVHFPATHERIAQRAAVAFEDGWRSLGAVFLHKPATPVHVTIDDYVDTTNAFANPRPFPRIHMRAYPPRWLDDLAGHGDWVRLLIFHELAHLMHLDDHGGLSKVINALLGPVYLPNQYLPRMIVEGIAVWAESRHPGRERADRGRIDSPQYMMKLRAFVLDEALPQLDELTGNPLRWPRGNAWYLFGSLLVDYQVRHFGIDRLRQFIRQYGRRPVPYAVNALYLRIYGISAQQMWRRAVAELKLRVRREHRLRDLGELPASRADAVLSQPVPVRVPPRQLPDEGERITFDGESKGRVRLHPNGRFAVYVSVPNNRLPYIAVLDLQRRSVRSLHVCELGCREPVFSKDGRQLYWSEGRPWRRLYSFQDVFAADVSLRGDSLVLSQPRRLTRGARTRRVVAGQPQIHRKRPPIVPRFDASQGLDRQGDWALRDVGTFRDLFCGDVQVIRSKRGIRSFAVDSQRRRIVSISPRANGFEVHLAKVPNGFPRSCRARSSQPPSARGYREKPLKPRAYRLLDSIWPRAWRPAMQLSSGLAPSTSTLGLRLSGRDAVGLHQYDASLQSDLSMQRPLATVKWRIQRYEPTFELAGTYAHNWTWFRRGVTRHWLRDRRVIGRAGVSWRYPRRLDFFDISGAMRVAHTSIRENLSLFRRPLQQHDPFGPGPIEPAVGADTLLTLGGSWTRAERYANSVTIERQWQYAAFVSYGSRWVGSNTPNMRVDLRTQHAWPLGGHRVLQWRARLGAGERFDDQPPPYSISGLPLFDPQALLFGGAGSDFSVVRGYRPVGDRTSPSLRGHVMGWTSLQAHLPWLNIGTGLDTLPFFLGRAWLVLFADAAATWERGEPLRSSGSGSGWVASAGAELRVDLEVGYVSQGALVFGAARAFGDVSSGQWYIRLAP